jgi:hypothetical protein
MPGLKTIAAALALSTLGSAALAGAAAADTWVLNAAACPDLREDRRDARHYDGRFDRREDWRDRRVINCPPHAWRYEPDRRDYRHSPAYYNHIGRYGTPGTVYRDRNGGFYVLDRYRRPQWIDVRIEYPRGRWHRDRYDRPYPDRPYHDRDGYRRHPY